MKEIFEQYGGVIITALVIGALALIITFLLTTGGPVATAFQTLVTNFLSKANEAIGVTP